VFAIVYIALDLNALHALRANQNTGLYLQSTVDLLRNGSTFDQPDGKPHMLVHDQWLIYAVLAPLVALWPRPETLIAVQIVALAAAAPMLYLFARTFGVSGTNALLLAIAFLVSPSLQGFAYDGFVGEDLIPVLAFSLAYAIRRKWSIAALAIAQLLLGVKEDEVYFLAWFGIVGAVFVDRTLGLGLTVLALLNGAVYYAIATHAGFTPEHPQYGLVDRELFGQLTFLIELLVPLAFAPLRIGWKLLVALPFLAEIFLAQDRSYPLFHIGSYYTVPIVVLATMATAYVAGRDPRVARFAVAGAIVMALFFNNASILHFGRRPFSPDPQYAIARTWATVQAPVDIPCEDVGAWTVASANINAKLTGCGTPAHRAGRPAWKDEPLDSTATWTRGAH
jgi:uncharacterized membrane protein